MKRDQIIGLDLIRFGAAAMVVFFHFTYWISRPADTTPGRITNWVFDFAPYGLSWGWVGVEIFFVLSGFVIAYSASSGSAERFFKSRVLRLAPSAWICATLTFAVALLVQDGDFAQLVARYVRSVAFFPGGPWIDGTYWTLGIEVAFYGLVLLLVAVRRFRWVEGLAVVLTVISGFYWGHHLLTDPNGRVEYSRVVELLLVRHGCFFGLGIMLWLVKECGLSIRRGVAIGASVAIGLVEIFYSTLEHDFARDPNWWLPMIIWVGALAAVVLSFKLNGRVHDLLGVRGATLARTLGLATYPLYLLHQLIGSACMAALWRMGSPQWVCLVVAVTCMFTLSVLVAKVGEPWVGGRLKVVLDSASDLSRRWRTRPAA